MVEKFKKILIFLPVKLKAYDMRLDIIERLCPIMTNPEPPWDVSVRLFSESEVMQVEITAKF